MHHPMAPMRSFFTSGCDARKVEGRVQVAFGAVFGDAAHEFVRHIRRGGDFAAIEIDAERDVALLGELRGLLFHPVVQSPPFVITISAGNGPLPAGV
jgi:hypothetical protein